MNHSIELNGVKCVCFNDYVVQAHFQNDLLISSKDMREIFRAIGMERSHHKGLVVVTLGEYSTLINEARALASGPEVTSVLAVDAIKMRDFGYRLAADFLRAIIGPCWRPGFFRHGVRLCLVARTTHLLEPQ